ncbi:hypothetical protein [Acinetobacter sp. A47]|uniref:hypothetical protein n=1 Tax=Acinetobacter sp. A47 TaxID=1561217 RepID=UPI0005718113|nr:hypothetical protein [Acinetobacter sp. A47]
MYFRDPSKYKYTTDNIIVGNAELHVVEIKGRKGWAKLGGGVIYDKQDAIKYATKLNQIIKHNVLRQYAQRNYRG